MDSIEIAAAAAMDAEWSDPCLEEMCLLQLEIAKELAGRCAQSQDIAAFLIHMLVEKTNDGWAAEGDLNGKLIRARDDVMELLK